MIWVTGAHGMLGSELTRLFSMTGEPFVGTGREVSILDRQAIEDFASRNRPKCIINCAAYTAVDKAEEETDLAKALNEKGPMLLARTANKTGATLIHVSTDYVFGGEGRSPILEDDPVSPINTYGSTKLGGEKAVLEHCSKYYLVRTSWLYGKGGPNFVRTMLELFKSRASVGVVDDQFGSPTYAPDLAEALVKIALTEKGAYGVYHYANKGVVSWYDFALKIQEYASLYQPEIKKCRVYPISSDEYPVKARRPRYSALSKEKIQRAFSLEVPSWEASLERHIKSLYGFDNSLKDSKR